MDQKMWCGVTLLKKVALPTALLAISCIGIDCAVTPRIASAAVSVFAYDQVRTIKIFAAVTIEPHEALSPLNDLISFRSVNRIALDVVKEALGTSSHIKVITQDDVESNASIDQQDPSLLVLAINVSVRTIKDPITRQSLEDNKNANGIAAISTITYRTARPFDATPSLFETRPEAFVLPEERAAIQSRLRDALSRQLGPLLTAVKARNP